ncbi:MAG: TIGR02680 family protein, partial [Eubacteriales bacterium]|nr:TIGR02680 family protein [Eubacteriales bacterium]
MNDRWRMNRMGFVNFWLYDEETFAFSDGKLFLRGANASGKSITTQSFIPFILDGDRSPNRLDPFGSSDRKMEYYFLGNGEKEDVTGYLFLEFKKGDAEQYKTIGIGQRAQKGKPMGFWGFIILDGKRIGLDVNLYQEVGSKKIPYAKQDLKKILGENNMIVDSQTEYMEAVNKYVFGFPRIEQYDQFIRLMIKVRAPKLSRDFKPTKVYEILNESLQTLSDDDLRAMVDAMEKMDDIQGRLDALKAALKDVQSIRTEYDHYNRYMLSKKAYAYTEAKKQVDLSKNKLNTHTTDSQTKQEKKTAKETENEQLSDAMEILTKEKEVLDADDLEASVDKLNNSKKRKEESEKEAKTFDEKIQDRRDQIRIYDAKQREYKKLAAGYQHEIRKMQQELEAINESLQFEEHDAVKEAISQESVRSEFARIKNALKEYAVAVEKGLKALIEAAQAENIWSRLEEELSALSVNQEKCAVLLKTAESMEMQCRDSIIEAFYGLTAKCRELIIAKEELEKLVSCVMNYEGAKDLGEVKKIIDSIYASKSRRLTTAKIESRNCRQELQEQQKNALRELDELKTMKDPTPVRRQKVAKAREILRAKGISCLPLYGAIEFRGGLTEEEQALLEEQLLDAGLLDALVVPDKDYEKAKAELQYLSDTLIWADPAVHTGFDKLVPGEADSELNAVVAQILDNIHENYTENAGLILSADGYFKNGMIEGHSVPEGPASFVGAVARRQNLLRIIEEKELECKVLEERLHDCSMQFETIQNSIAVLDKEYEELPTFDNLDQAIGMVQEANYVLTKASEECEKKEKESAELLAKKKACQQIVIANCRGLPFERTIAVYQEAVDSVGEYRDTMT